MVAAAALISRKVLPEMAMDMALVSPFFINLPLAPAEGLIVVDSGFERNGNGQVRSCGTGDIEALNDNWDGVACYSCAGCGDRS